MRTEAPRSALAPAGRRRVPEPQSEPQASDAHAPLAPRRRGRLLAAGALLLALLVVLVVLLTRDSEYSYGFVFESAGQLVRGDVVRIGGTPAGTVSDIELTPDSRAKVTVSVNDDFGPLHGGTTATIRAQSLIGVANRFVDVQPGPNFRRALDDGAVLDAENTTTIVELDQLFNALDPPTRKGLQQWFRGFGDWYSGKEGQANVSARYFPPTLVATTRLLNEINRDSEVLRQFLVNSSTALGALAERREDLTGFVGNGGTTARALAADTDSLSQVLAELPPALRQGSDTLVALRPALDDLQRFVVESKPATKDLGPFFREFRPVAENGAPLFRQLRLAFKGPGASNDLYDLLRDLPPLATLTERAVPRARRALRESVPIFGFGRPYTPDLTSWIRSFGQSMATYDANGHYLRGMPVFDAYTFVDDADGGHLEPKPPAQRGRGAPLTFNNLRRCPGTAAPAPADGSAPFVDSGELANADCDPSQTVRPTP
jgi:phospholipid/cholesterol/gamma-HCH transport system substrate-binding protein